MNTKFYKIRKTTSFSYAEDVYMSLSEHDKYKIENLVSKEIYSALLFKFDVVSKIEDYCDKFFDCGEKGLSYELGCYFQKREYEHEGFIESDIRRFSSLLKVYNKQKYPKEYELICNLIASLAIFKERWLSYEEYHPELFSNN